MLIAIEGIDGSGKSTLAKYLAESLNAIYVREPDQSDKITKYIREVTLNSTYNLNWNTRELLLIASRSISNEKTLRYLSDGDIVVSDRCFLSGMVYSNLDSKIEFNTYLNTLTNFKCLLIPNLIIYVTPSVRKISKVENDIYDNKNDIFYSQLDNTFHKAISYLNNNDYKVKVKYFTNDFTQDIDDRLKTLKRYINEE